MKNKIAQRLTKYFALALVLFALTAGTLFSLMFARHTADVTRRDLRAHAVSIAKTIERFTADCEEGECKGGGFKAYMRYIGDAATGELYLLNRDAGHAVIGEMKAPETPPPQEALPLVQRVFETGEVAESAVTINPAHMGDMMVCAPVSDAKDAVRYVLVMRAGVHGITHALLDTFYMFAACLAIAMVIAIAASFFLSRRFVTPLHKMMNAATQMAQGDYSVKTHVAQQDEIGVLAAHIDELVDKLSEAEKARARFDQMRQDFFSDISHELRTPIAVLKGNMEMLCTGMIEDEDKRRQVYDQLYMDAHHLQRLVDDLLELTRLKNPEFKIEMEIINLMDVLGDSIRFMRPKADEKGMSIRMDGAEPFAVKGDYGRLRQLMIILLDNAIKFSAEGEQVVIAVKKKKDACEVSVTDHGCGIGEEEIGQIFDRYFHNRTGKNRSGTGLGLPVAREIALRHGIEMICRSKEGEGTSFRLTFAECPMENE